MRKIDSNHPLLCDANPWRNNSNSIWLASTLSLNRNLEKFNFPNKLPEEKRKHILDMITPKLQASDQLKNPQVLLAHETLPIEKEFLVEHFLSSQGFHHSSKGDAFVIDETGEFLATINLRDHLTLQRIDIQEELEDTWEKLVKVEMQLQDVSYAFNPKFGFLSSDPTMSGTGLIVHIFLHLPALIYTDNLIEAVGKYKDESIELTGLQGDPNELVGDIVVFHNVYTLGLTEETILTSLRTLAAKMIIEEKTIRSRLQQNQGNDVIEIKDKVSRAFGVLMHSYQIEAIEALQAISLLKLGLDLKWIEGTTPENLNKLLFNIRRAHLLCHYSQDKISQDELLHKRAEYIHQSLKGTELLV